MIKKYIRKEDNECLDIGTIEVFLEGLRQSIYELQKEYSSELTLTDFSMDAQDALSDMLEHIDAFMEHIKD
jgi:3-keto-L-gulonate-6-phosphate decarboxylase